MSNIDLTDPDFGDGETHINIWFRGKTPLGRMLSHFYESPFIHPYFGPFESMEGFWHWIKGKRFYNSAEQINNDNEDIDALRSLSGGSAKSHSKKFISEFVPGFNEIINTANFYKIEQNPELKKLFLESTLEFDQYHLFGPGDVLIRTTGHEWIIQGFEDNRAMMKEGKRPTELDYFEQVYG